MLSRGTRASKQISRQFKRFNSHEHGHHDVPEKTVEINITKIFGIAALLGGLLVWKNNDPFAAPLVQTKLYDEEDNREEKRVANYNKRYKESLVKQFIRDNGGLGQRIYRRIGLGPVPQTVIPAHSPYGTQYGAGIDTAVLGPRKERIPVYAPIQ
ncbi:uncharacterized protein KQ657_000235 [Scheffersomyces spartinae]|uniref:Uncharacterized protein n=1 Tax=Scheffersomyces spartinae TaxID=45513 RepID=A0A9P7VEA7_9ASCO|nr:uncharacterized protein KQ657_000235 [Scheffersomyces spartinae]KAG7196222.1 hypothetical protein KQ657_000235 [Scheffersomyces spartinae]